jgi:hypothetical protein
MRPQIDTDFDRTREFPHDPTFVCELDDGRIIRMLCFCADGKLDWARGERLVEFVLADGDRFRGNKRKPKPVRCWFERKGERIDRPRGKNDTPADDPARGGANDGEKP